MKESGEYATFYLFNDIMLKVKEKDKGGPLKLLMHITLKTSTVVDVQDDPETST
jgi:hypothetical protein